MDLTPANVQHKVDQYRHCDDGPGCSVLREGISLTVTTEGKTEDSDALHFYRSVAVQTIQTEEFVISKQHPALNQVQNLAINNSEDISATGLVCPRGQPEVLSYSNQRVASVSEREMDNFHREAAVLDREEAVTKREEEVLDREEKVTRREEEVLDREEKVTRREEEVLVREQKVTIREVAFLAREEIVEKREKAVLESEQRLQEMGKYIQENYKY